MKCNRELIFEEIFLVFHFIRIETSSIHHITYSRMTRYPNTNSPYPSPSKVPEGVMQETAIIACLSCARFYRDSSNVEGTIRGKQQCVRAGLETKIGNCEIIQQALTLSMDVRISQIYAVDSIGSQMKDLVADTR